MADASYDELVKKQFQEVCAKYQSLNLKESDNCFYILGTIGFTSEFEGVKIQDAFELFIAIPREYPNKIPAVKEIGGRIPKEFHHNGDDTLCLGTPVDTWIKFSKHKTLIGFVEFLIIPFLFSFCFKSKMGRMPFGERTHYGEGILEFYCEFFKIKDFVVAQKFLKILASGQYSRNKPCPCDSGIRLKKCHGPKLREAMNTIPLEYFEYEYKQSQFH